MIGTATCARFAFPELGSLCSNGLSMHVLRLLVVDLLEVFKPGRSCVQAFGVSCWWIVLHVEPEQIAVELDGNVAQRERWGDISIAPRATLEIVRFVGGG